MCCKVVSEIPVVLKYCLDKDKSQEMSNTAVDDFLPTLKFVPDWFVTNKMPERVHDTLLANDDILFFDEDFSNITFFGDEIGIFSVDLYELHINEINFDEGILKLIFMSYFWLGTINVNNARHLKKIEANV